NALVLFYSQYSVRPSENVVILRLDVCTLNIGQQLGIKHELVSLAGLQGLQDSFQQRALLMVFVSETAEPVQFRSGTAFEDGRKQDGLFPLLIIVGAKHKEETKYKVRITVMNGQAVRHS